jgi:hypothetical protein
MRTFHTGGIFTSEARQQIISPVNGIVRFYKILKTVLLRTNRGEDVLITKNSGSIILIPENKNHDLTKIEVLRNTILFPKNNQYILKDTVIGELLNTNKQIKTEIKPILSDTCGEIFIPKLKKKVNLLNNNKLIWILSGQLYNSPINSFINFYPGYKLNQHSYIFRTKIINHYQGFITFLTNQKNLQQKLVRITNTKYSLINSKLQKLTETINTKNYLLSIQNFNYLIKVRLKNDQFYLQLTRNKQIGTLLTNTFRTLTGGTLYYDYQKVMKCDQRNKTILYLNRMNLSTKYKPIISYRTIVWLGEETHRVNCEPNILLVEHGDFISEGFELIPGFFSKTSGIVIIKQKNNLVQTISIKSGLVYEGKKFKNTSKKMYYPGEVLFSNIPVKYLSFCENIPGKTTDKFLVRPIEIYEISHLNLTNLENQVTKESTLTLNFDQIYSYKSNQIIKGTKNLSLISNVLTFKPNKFLKKNIHIELFNNKKRNIIDFRISERFSLNNYLNPHLKYKDIQSAFLVQAKQFIDCYTTLGYLEASTLNSLEIVKFKMKIKETKQLLLISNENCFTVEKEKFSNKRLNDFIIDNKNVNATGKIIIENSNLFTVQKGRPYFFPNCKNDELITKTNLQYKIIAPTRVYSPIKTPHSISLNYQNILKLSLNRHCDLNNFINIKIPIKTEFSKLCFKKNGKLYSSLIPQFLKKFSVHNSSLDTKHKLLIKPNGKSNGFTGKLDRTLLFQSSEIVKNQYQSSEKLTYQLTLIKFVEHSFIKATKSVGLYSITEDYFEQDLNSVFCKNSEFIDTGETMGLLNLEKEITGDIVQGLPRIEEILEARKKNLMIKKLPTSQKKALLVSKTSLDPNFEFKKLATSIKENEKINPHKLLKVYFNYYGLIKFFICDQTEQIKSNRLLKNYEGSYKSFKKVQSFILNSVQSVYQSQGVTINDKHLEIIIKQMTTKVLITYEGNTPLLRREVIDLYHIQYINKIIQLQNKQLACYVPLLLGITKAALNNPSFISAASFQETTRVLTKAAIEGRIDWLRGLKENIIIGHLIPAGTGSKNYRNCFKRQIVTSLKLKPTFEKITNIKQKT